MSWRCDRCNEEKRQGDATVKVEFRLSDGSVLVTGMHASCAKKVANESLDDLYKNICARWEEELTHSSMSDENKQRVRDKYYGCHIKSLLKVTL